MGLDLVEIVMEIEDRLGVDIPDEDVGEFFRQHELAKIRVGDFFEFIWQHGSAGVSCRKSMSPLAFNPGDKAAAWEIVRSIIAEISGVASKQITEDTLMFQDLDLN